MKDSFLEASLPDETFTKITVFAFSSDFSSSSASSSISSFSSSALGGVGGWSASRNGCSYSV